MTTTFMGLDLPVVGTTLGPVWSTQLNTAFEDIDEHDHTSGSGNKVPTAGLSINANLPINDFNLIDVGLSTYTNLTSLSSELNTIYVKDGDLYYNDAAGNQIRITTGGALNVGSVGGISGDYGTTAATAFYTDASLTYFFQDSNSDPADFFIGEIDATNGIFSGDISAEDCTLSGELITTGVRDTSLTASKAIFTDGSSNLISNEITGSGNVVMSTTPTITTPVFSGNPSGTVVAGSYTPTLTTNYTQGAESSKVFHYQRIGNTVFVSGQVVFAGGTGSSTSQVTVTLPIATSSLAPAGSFIYSTNDTTRNANMDCVKASGTTGVQTLHAEINTSSSAHTWTFEFSYQIS